jgi:hypothetical protein
MAGSPYHRKVAEINRKGKRVGPCKAASLTLLFDMANLISKLVHCEVCILDLLDLFLASGKSRCLAVRSLDEAQTTAAQGC